MHGPDLSPPLWPDYFVTGSCRQAYAASVQVLVCGAELYTSNSALMPVAYYEKKATLKQVMFHIKCTHALQM